MSKLTHPDSSQRFDRRTGTFRRLSEVESLVENAVIGALSGTRNMIQYLVDPHESDRTVDVTGAAIDAQQDVGAAVLQELSARGFGDWSLHTNVVPKEEYFPQDEAA